MPGVSSDEPHDQSAPPAQSKCQPAGFHQVLLLRCQNERRRCFLVGMLGKDLGGQHCKLRGEDVDEENRDQQERSCLEPTHNGEPTTLHELHLLFHNLQLTFDHDCKRCYWKHEMTAFGPTTVAVPSAIQSFHQVHSASNDPTGASAILLESKAE